MTKSYKLLAIAFLLIAGAGLFNLKIMVESKERELKQLQQQVLDDQRAIRVLKAEWAYLNRPENIQSLAVKYLGLRPVSSKQIVGNLSDLPWRVAEGKINAPLVDYVLPAIDDPKLEIREAKANHSEVVVFNGATRKPVDAISLMMMGEFVNVGGGHP